MSAQDASSRRPLAAGGFFRDDATAGWAARLLDRALRIADGGPRPFFQAAIASLAVTSLLVTVIAAVIRPRGPLPQAQREMIVIALAGAVLSAVLGVASAAGAGRSRLVSWLDRMAAPRDRAAIWLALAAWFPLLLLVAYYRARTAFPPPVRYIYMRFDDKRWETTAYLLGVVAPAICLAAATRILVVGRGKPRTWRAWLTGVFRGAPR